MGDVNIFKDIGSFDFTTHNVRLDQTSKIILKKSIQEQYDNFIEHIKNNQSEAHVKYNRYIKGVFSTNPLEHCLINYYLHSTNGNFCPNKYNSSGLISYLLLVGFTGSANYIKEQVWSVIPEYKFEDYDFYLMKLDKLNRTI